MKRHRVTSILGPALLLVVAFGLAAGPNSAQSVVTQNPTGIQKFAIAAGESTSFGFAVNKPGLIIVVCAWQGGQLSVTLNGPLAQPITQTGSGQLKIQYAVTQQDINKGQLWGILIHQPNVSVSGQAQAGKPVLIDASNAASLVHRPQIVAQGTLDLEHPPGDVNQALAQAKAARGTASSSKLQVQSASVNAQIQALFKARQTALATQVANQQAAQAAQVRLKLQSLGQPPPKSPPPPPGPSGGNPATGQVITVGIVPSKVGFTFGPQISSLTVNQGQPKDPVGIIGTGFGSAPGEVHFVVNPGKDLIAPIAEDPDPSGPGHPIWSATGISVTVPYVDGVLAYSGYVYVISGGKKSNQVPFQFNPVQDLIQLPIRSGNAAWGLPTCLPAGSNIITELLGQMLNDLITVFLSAPTATCGFDSSGNALEAMSGGWLGGVKEDDQFFQNYQLKNGWVMDSLNFTQADTSNANCYVAASNIGTSSPNVDVHWWVNGTGLGSSASYTGYELSIYIRGPKGVPYQ